MFREGDKGQWTLTGPHLGVRTASSSHYILAISWLYKTVPVVPKSLKGTWPISAIETKNKNPAYGTSTDADSSTDAVGGWTKNTLKPVFF